MVAHKKAKDKMRPTHRQTDSLGFRQANKQTNAPGDIPFLATAKITARRVILEAKHTLTHMQG